MASPARANLIWVIGDDETVTLTITSDADGLVPVDITGRTYTLSVGTVVGGTPTLALTGSVTGPSGLVSFSATDTQTDALTERGYVFDIVEVSGSAESTLVLGHIQAIERVTA